MGMRYLNGIPFATLPNGRTVQDLDSWLGPFVTRTGADLMSYTGLTLPEIHNMFKGDNTLYQIALHGWTLTADNNARIQVTNPLHQYTLSNIDTGAYYTDGVSLTDSNSQIVGGAGSGYRTFVYYPVTFRDPTVIIGGDSLIINLCMGFVDTNNNITFVNIEGTPDIEVNDPAFLVDNGQVSFYSVIGQSMFADATWGNTPELGGLLGMFDIRNRFSPRTAQRGTGMYRLNRDMVDELMKDLWETTLPEQFNYKVLGDPVNGILSLKWYYGINNDLQIVQDGSGNNVFAPLTLGNVKFPNVQTNVIKSEFVVHDFGTINIYQQLQSSGRLKGNYLDYAPHVQYHLYLPFYGYVDINPNEFMDGTLGLQLNINLLTGQGLYVIYSSSNKHQTMNGQTDSNPQVVMTVPCSLSVEIPLNITSMNSLGSIVSQSITTAVGTGVMTAMPAAMPLAGAAMATGDKVASATAMASLTERQAQMKTGVDIGSNLSQFVPPAVYKNAGSFNVETGSISSLVPFLYIVFPIVATPQGFEDVYGNRASVIDSLSNCSGFTQIVAAAPDNDRVNHKYQSEILALLQNGVYL